ncbi:MAG: PDP protein [Sulfurospirillum sp.]|nr:PDP protein [Sulfurospirillum sp.]
MIVWVLFFCGALYSETIDCTKVFEERKSELLQEIEKIDESRQSFEALKAATNALFEKQQQSLEEQKKDINTSLEQITQKEEAIKKMLEENKQLLATIDGKKDDKLTKTYEKMKDASAAAIFEALPQNEAAAILFLLPAKKVSSIMTKMDAQIASKLTQLLKIGPPFEATKIQREQADGTVQ